MKQQTPVDWLIQIVSTPLFNIPQDVIDKAKLMEREQRMKDYGAGYNAGYQDAQCNHINDAENYVNEQDYLNSDSTV